MTKQDIIESSIESITEILNIMDDQLDDYEETFTVAQDLAHQLLEELESIDPTE